MFCQVHHCTRQAVKQLVFQSFDNDTDGPSEGTYEGELRLCESHVDSFHSLINLAFGKRTH